VQNDTSGREINEPARYGKRNIFKISLAYVSLEETAVKQLKAVNTGVLAVRYNMGQLSVANMRSPFSELMVRKIVTASIGNFVERRERRKKINIAKSKDLLCYLST
jgi:hypothetical protein